MQEEIKDHAQDSVVFDGMEQMLEQIFDQVCKSAVTTAEGLVSWNASPEVRSHLGPQLYDGSSGIALFLGAYCFATKNRHARDLALRSAAQLRLDVAQIASRTNAGVPGVAGTGGLKGVVSASYALARLAHWLKMPELIESAQEAATALTQRQILTEERFDIIGGCAGSLLALLALVEELRASGLDTRVVLELALLYGRRLLESRIPGISGMRVWPSVDIASPGFARGASGIGYALVRLFQHTSREEFRDAALEAFAFERGLLATQPEKWIDPDHQSQARRASWGQGAPGIALSRVISIATVDSPAVRRDLEESIRISRVLPESAFDSLCFGNFGRADILYTASSILGRLQLAEQARELARVAMLRAAVSGFRLGDGQYGAASSSRFAMHPTLFLGLCGVGYTLLRLSYPDLFPSVLFLETQQ